MKILHLVMLCALGGTEVMLLNLIKHYPDKTVEHVIFNGVEKKDINKADLCIIEGKLAELSVRSIHATSFVTAKDMVDFIQAEGCDLIHVPNPFPFFVPAYIMHLLEGTPVVSVWHNSPLMQLCGISPEKRTMYQKAEEDGIVLCSVNPYASMGYEKELGLKKVLSLVNGIDVPSFAFSQEKREAIRAQHQIPDNALVIGSVGRIDLDWKRQDWIIDALAALHDKGLEHVYVLIIGDGKGLEALKALAHYLGLEEYVKFAGTQQDTPSYYSAMDIFAHASKDESFGLVIVEALSSGLPMVISTPNKPDGTQYEGYGIVSNGVNGIVVGNDKKTFCESIEKLVCDEKLRMQCARCAYGSVQKFDVCSMAKEYHRVFSEAATHRGTPNIPRLCELATMIQSSKAS